MKDSDLRIIALLIAGFGQVFNWIAFCTSVWGKRMDSATGDTYRSIGIWLSCPSDNVTPCFSYVGTQIPHHVAIQAMACLGFAVTNYIFIAAVISIVYSKVHVRNFSIFNGVMALYSAVFWLVGVIVYGANYNSKNGLMNAAGRPGLLGYGYWAAILLIILEFVQAVPFFMQQNSETYGVGQSPEVASGSGKYMPPSDPAPPVSSVSQNVLPISPNPQTNESDVLTQLPGPKENDSDAPKHVPPLITTLSVHEIATT